MSYSPLLMVVGTRPEAIKLAPLAAELEHRGLAPCLLLTGQHPRLDLEALGLRHLPAIQLHRKAGGDPHSYADHLAQAIQPHLRQAATQLVIVQGDTASALGGALAGFRTVTPVAHVEAGLRSHDPALPWPEEDNRVAIDAGAALLFAPTATSAENLRREGVSGAVHITGNTGIDALRQRVGRFPTVPRSRLGGLPRLLVTCHRRENWGAAFLPVALALLEIARSPWVGIDVVLHPNPQQAELMRELLSGNPRIRLLAPMGHEGMLAAMQQSFLILSDSGGIQEEAPALGIPLLVLRSKTERPEGIASGNMVLVGTESGRIVDEVRRLLDDDAAYRAMATPALPYGDGYASQRIADTLVAWLKQRQQQPLQLTA